jgi:hypothetical protein
MVIFGVPYFEQRLTNMGEITGGGPYGATTQASADGALGRQRRRPNPLDCYFMIRASEPGNAHVVTSRRSALILLANTVGASGLDEVTCWF